MIINFSEISANKRYHFLTQTIIPRPIAWVLSENEDSSLNLAPFSFFNAMCSDPPLLALSIGKKDSGEVKDTGRNLLSDRDFVIHIAHEDQAATLTNTAASLDYGISEVSINNLEVVRQEAWPLPRLKNCQIAYHCRLYDSHKIGPNQQTIIYAEVIDLYLDDAVIDTNRERISINADRVKPLSRLGAAQFAGITDSFSIKRPS